MSLATLGEPRPDTLSPRRRACPALEEAERGEGRNRQSRIKASQKVSSGFCSLEGWKAARGTHGELKPQHSAPNLSSITLPAPHN